MRYIMIATNGSGKHTKTNSYSRLHKM